MEPIICIFEKWYPGECRGELEKKETKEGKLSDKIIILNQAVGNNEASIKINSSGDRKQIYRYEN